MFPTSRSGTVAFALRRPTAIAMAARVVLATGGRSLPKSGSDGAGFEIARRLGHTLVSTTPALVPLLLEAGQHAMHRELSGVAHDAELTLWTDGAVEIRLRGSLLWTHFGISGPVTLDMSRHWLRAALEGRRASLTLSFCPGVTFEDIDRRWTARASERPHTSVATQLAELVPASVADAAREAAARHPRHDARPSVARHPSPPVACARELAADRDRRSRLQLRRGDRRAASSSMKSIRQRCDRACVRGCRWSARSSTSTAASAGSIFSGPGRARALPARGLGT